MTQPRRRQRSRSGIKRSRTSRRSPRTSRRRSRRVVRRYRSSVHLSELHDGRLTPEQRRSEGDRELLPTAKRVVTDAHRHAEKRYIETGLDTDLLTLKFAGTWTLKPRNDGILVDTGWLGQFIAPTMENILQNAMRLTLSCLNGDWEYISVEGIRPSLDSTYEHRVDDGNIIMEDDARVYIHAAPLTTYPQSLWLYNKGKGGPILRDDRDGFEKIRPHVYYSFDMIPDEYKVVKALLTSHSRNQSQTISIPFGRTWTVSSRDDGTDICTIENVNGYLFLTYKVWDDDDERTSLPSPIIEIPDDWFAKIRTDD